MRFFQRKVDTDARHSSSSPETKVSVRNLERTKSFTEDDERITFSWENLTVQATIPVAAAAAAGGDDEGGGWCCGGGGGATRIKTILKNGAGIS
jgi:hypothetical protein